LRVAGALGLAFFPVSLDFIPAILPPLHAEAPAKTTTPRTYARTQSIRLPIQIDERTCATLSELKLFVKRPGADWACVQSAAPNVNGFDFRADKDGEYAFMFVTVDKTGRKSPASCDDRPPHQIIIVDTVPPELGVQPLPVANRDIFLQCQVHDANPDWLSVKLEYLDGEGQWRAMELATPETPGVFRIPQASVLEGKVRATARDKAGNSTQRVVDLGDPTQSYRVAAKPDLSKPAVDKDPGLVLPPVDGPEVGPVQAGMKVPAKNEVPDIKIPDIDVKSPASSPTRTKPTEKADPVTVPAILDTVPADNPKASTDSGIVLPPDVSPNTSAKVDPFLPDLTPKETPAPKVADVAKVDPPPAADHRPAANYQGTHPIINTTRCTLDYAVENVIVGGQPKMEFWATRDGGKNWSRVTDEAPGRSPARLLLPSDGLYGIRIKANGSGIPPQPGEAPDAWVEVDTIVPTVRLQPPTLGNGAEAGTLTISWMVHDKNLAPNSLNLYYASRREGPWTPIANGLRNDGSYRWLIPAGIGTEVYIKLEASDRAGNVGKAELQDPVPMPQPKVRVLGIGPAR
jgi:hypothetical protein